MMERSEGGQTRGGGGGGGWQGVGGGRASWGGGAGQGCRDQIRTQAKGKQGKERRLLSPGGESQGGCPRPERTMGT